MWGPRYAARPSPMQNVFFRCPPQASTGGAKSNEVSTDAGVKPRERRSTVIEPAISRTTESSQREAMSRSCRRKASAIPDSVSSASAFVVAIGSSERLPDVITRGRPASASSRSWSGVYGRRRPTNGLRGATSGARAASGRRRTSTMGRSADVSASRSPAVRRASASAAARSGTMTASGFSSRCLRRRRRATDSDDVASHARWNPPRPLSATIIPARRALAAPAIGSSQSSGSPAESVAERRGPQAGHAFGWAWKRRSSGSSYSRRHAAHMGKRAIVVAGRSYGTFSAIVKRGPQLVQLVKG